MSDTDHSEAPYAFAAPPRVVAPIEGTTTLFPVRRIYCVGRNYKAHIREMGGDERENPFFFQKPADAIVTSGSSIPYPLATTDFQHEIELVAAIGPAGIFGMAVGIDLTRRDLQVAARNAGRPWEAGKAFDRSAPVSAIRPWRGEAPKRGRIRLTVNGAVRQDADLSEMVWNVEEVMNHLCGSFSLLPGDLIFTGTPGGVGKIVSGDVVAGAIDGVGELTVSVADPLT